MRRLTAILVLWAVTLAPVKAEILPAPTVEYSADSTLDAAGMKMRTRVYYSPGKQRREVTSDGQQQVMILRVDKSISWMLMPDSRQYMDMPLSTGMESSGAVEGYEVQRTAAGKERVNGLDTTRYKAVLETPAGIRLEGFIWVTEQGLLVKLDANATGSEVSGRMRMDVTNVRFGPQDPRLFEIPAGYTKYQLQGLGAP
jgi:outer membrane lipoprotein-sorting protein